MTGPSKPPLDLRRRMLLGGAVGVVVVAVLLAGQTLREGSELENGLRQAVEQMSPSLPVQMDEVTTWTGLEATADTLTTTYTLAGAAGDYDGPALIEALRPGVVGQVCGGGDATVARALRLGATFRYAYVAEDGGEVGEFSVTEGDCGAG